MSEIALVTARRTKLQKLIDEGDSGAAAAVKLGEDPTKFLSTIQIGITSIGVLNGIVGEAALAAPLAIWLASLGVSTPFSNYAATGIVVVTITYFSIVVGELVPKRIGQSYPETFARLVARPINLLDQNFASSDGRQRNQGHASYRRGNPRHARGRHVSGGH
jgi:putative hemolysin